eukprot:6191229-Pleurochrysis_carterae.AAC.2
MWSPATKRNSGGSSRRAAKMPEAWHEHEGIETTDSSRRLRTPDDEMELTINSAPASSATTRITCRMPASASCSRQCTMVGVPWMSASSFGL